MDELAAGFDYLGVYHTADDATVRKVVAYGKPVICWGIPYSFRCQPRDQPGRSRPDVLNIPYVTSATAEPQDTFSTGSRAAGDLPWTVDQGWGAQPVIDAASASVVLDKSENFSYRLGSMGPVTKEIHSITFEMCWPQELPSNLQHAGIAFGQQDDTPYRVLVPSSVGGYHLIIRPAGELVLYRRDPGNPAGTRLQTIATSPVKPGEWMHFKIDVTPSSIRFSRVDGAGWSGETMDREYAGATSVSARITLPRSPSSSGVSRSPRPIPGRAGHPPCFCRAHRGRLSSPPELDFRRIGPMQRRFCPGTGTGSRHNGGGPPDDNRGRDCQRKRPGGANGAACMRQGKGSTSVRRARTARMSVDSLFA